MGQWRALSGGLALLVLGSIGAEARIVCHEGYQVVDGQEISTPYCNDNYVAAVARSRGVKVSDEAVRNNPAKKDEICRAMGSDIRIQHYCDTDSGRDRGH
jgi:hypothetical protein